MKFCGNCGNKLNANDAFCKECGSKVGATAPVNNQAPVGNSQGVVCDKCGSKRVNVQIVTNSYYHSILTPNSYAHNDRYFVCQDCGYSVKIQDLKGGGSKKMVLLLLAILIIIIAFCIRFVFLLSN